MSANVPAAPNTPPSASGAALDPYAPGPGPALDARNKFVDTCWDTANYLRWLLETRWYVNACYHAGVQWIKIDYQTKSVRNRNLPKSFPRAITNKLGQVNNDLISFLTSSPVTLNPAPQTDDEDDKSTAEVANRFEPVVRAETDWDALEEPTATWVILTGNAFHLPYYDYNPDYGTVPVDMLKCPTCGHSYPKGDEQLVKTAGSCPYCMQMAAAKLPGAPSEQIAALLPPLEPSVVEQPIGRLCTDLLSPFEIYLDNTVSDGKHQWFFRVRRYDLEKAKATWKDVKEDAGETPLQGQKYLDALAFIGANPTATYGTGGGGVGATKRSFVFISEFYHLPCAEYPAGLRVVRQGKTELESGPMPPQYHYKAGRQLGRCFLPLTQFGFDYAPGSAWYRSRSDDLVPMQHRRNIIETQLQLTIQRTGSPKLLKPEGSTSTAFVGESGQEVTYRPISFGGTSFAKPEYMEAALGNLGPIAMWIDRIDDRMERVAGTYFLVGGDVPSGITAASALSLLDERAVRALSSLKRKWARSYKQRFLQCLEIMRTHMTDSRLRMVLGKNKEWQAEQFSKADLSGAIDINIDYDSLFPKSQATQRATIFQLDQMGIIDPSDTEQRDAVLEAFGESRMKPSVKEAVEQASREYDQFMNEDIQPLFIPAAQDHVTHILQHRRDLQSQEFEALYRNPATRPKADLFIAHLEAHMNAIAAAQAVMAAPTDPAAAGGDTGSQKGSQSGSNHGAGQQTEPTAAAKGRKSASANRGEVTSPVTAAGEGTPPV